MIRFRHDVKITLSYLTDFIIEVSESIYSGKLKLSLSNGRFQLSTSNAVYSYEDRYTTFKEAFRQLKLSKQNINTCLVLGYGLGSIPLMLNKHHKITPLTTGVEIDPQIISWARQ